MASIKRELAKGVFWIAIAKYSGIVIQILITDITFCIWNNCCSNGDFAFSKYPL